MTYHDPRYRTPTRCRLCGSNRLDPFLDLGMTPLADAFVKDPLAPETTYPLSVLLCADCGLSQLSVVVSPEVLYDADYVYEASVTTAGREHFRALAADLTRRFADPRSGPGAYHPGETADLAVDVGCNDGVLLDGFARAGLRAIGIDPAPTVTALARQGGHDADTALFTTESALKVVRRAGQARIVTATNVFAHVDDLNAFMRAVDVLLEPLGVLVIEAPHFLRLVEGLEYDTIYHEHLSYLTVAPLVKFFVQRGYRLFDVQPVGIHGGSLRLFVDRIKRFEEPSVYRHECQERDADVFDLGVLRAFGARVHEHRRELVNTLDRLKRRGKRIAGISAPAKGMTLLNTARVGSDLLEFLTERSPLKVGRYAPGSRLPILEDTALVEHGIDVALILAWNFAREISMNQVEFRAAGGTFLRPIPWPEPMLVEVA